MENSLSSASESDLGNTFIENTAKTKPSQGRLGKLFNLSRPSKASLLESQLQKETSDSAKLMSPIKFDSLTSTTTIKIDLPTADSSPGELAINPCVRPMGQKLRARIEPSYRPSKRIAKPAPLLVPANNPAFSPTRINKRHRRRSTYHKVDHNTSSPLEDNTMKGKMSVRSAGVMRVRNGRRVSFTPENQIDQVLRFWNSGENVGDTCPVWKWYLTGYANGSLSMSRTPEPPSFGGRDSYRYLPALYPSNYKEMVEHAGELDHLWPEWTTEKQKPIQELMFGAIEHFQAQVALSFFDEEFEILKGENGYGAKYIPRDVSFAAHALLSTEVFAVSDTRKAAQFRQHPLVLGEPKIRFFAGAPMLSSHGVPIGVFSIWSRKPREFSVFQKRELSNYAFITMNELQNQARAFTGFNNRSTPLLDRYSLINADHGDSPRDSHAQSLQEDEPELVRPLRFYKDQTPIIEATATFASLQIQSESLCEQTPPSSAESNQGPLFDNFRSGYDKNWKFLSVVSDLGSSYPQLHDMITPDSPEFNFDDSRPFSGSDLTSVHREPNNTPFNIPSGGEVEDFLALSDRDVSENFDYPEQDYSAIDATATVDVPTTTAIHPELDETKSFSEAVQFSSEPDLRLTAHNLSTIPDSPLLIDLRTPPRDEDIPALELSQGREQGPSEDGTLIPSSYRTTQSSYITRASDQTLATSIPDADMMMAQYAQEFGYRLMYVVRLSAPRSGMTNEELCASGALRYDFLASSMPSINARNLTAQIHVDAMRASGALTLNVADRGLVGILLPYQTESGPPKSRDSAIVIAAYKYRQEGDDDIDFDVETAKMQMAIRSLDKILALDVNTALPNFDLSENILDSFPASEAMEIGSSFPSRISVRESMNRKSNNTKQYRASETPVNTDPFVSPRICEERFVQRKSSKPTLSLMTSSTNPHYYPNMTTNSDRNRHNPSPIYKRHTAGHIRLS